MIILTSYPFYVTLIFSVLLTVVAQTTDGPKRDVNNLFRWKFDDNFVSTTLPACENRPIIASARETTPQERGSPPYYMIAIVKNGRPRRYYIGDDPDHLNWTPDLDLGAQMVLTVVDRNGGAGGSGGSQGSENDQLYTIDKASPNNTCIITQPSISPFTVTANVKDRSLDVCEPWSIEVAGGTPPYTFTLVQPTSPNNTNVTNLPSQDAFIYINRATSGLLLAVAVSDSKQEFASGTPVVMVSGSTNPDDCQGNSRGTTVLEIRQQEQDNRARASKKKQIAIGVGVTFALLIPLSAVAFFYFQRRRGRVRKVKVSPRGDFDPALTEHKDSDETFTWSEPSAPLAIIPSRFATGVTPFNAWDRGLNGGSPHSLRSNPSFTTFPVSSVAMAKAAEARTQRQNSYDSFRPTQPNSRRASIVIQHEDGGEIRELPPPYADRSQRSRQDEDLIVGSSSTANLSVSPLVFNPPELVPLTAGPPGSTEKIGDLESGTLS
jgi:hypothetical protein